MTIVIIPNKVQSLFNTPCYFVKHRLQSECVDGMFLLYTYAVVKVGISRFLTMPLFYFSKKSIPPHKVQVKEVEREEREKRQEREDSETGGARQSCCRIQGQTQRS